MAATTITEPAVSINANAPVGPTLKIVDGRPMVPSTSVAEHFRKRHKDVLRSITQTCHHLPDDFCGRNFALTFTEVPQPKGGTRKERSYMMTRDGFVIVAMGFTGKEAMAWKIRYIEAFNAMEADRMGPVSGTLTASQQQEIKELVQAKASVFPDAVKPKVFSQVWMRLQRKFKVPRYAELPAGLFGEARDYVIAMQIRSVDAPALEGSDTPALPPGRTRNTLDDYKALYKNLPESPQYWMDLLSRYSHAHEILGSELEAIKTEATKPFRVGRKSMVQTYFDASMSPLYSLFDTAEKSLHLAYCQVFDAMEGCRNIWLLLHKG